MTTHALHSPSSADKWMLCAGAVAMEQAYGVPDEGNENAAQGTAAHFLAANCLESGADPLDAVNAVIWVHKSDAWFDDTRPSVPPAARRFVVDAEMANHVATYVAYVRASVDKGGVLLVEQRLPISQITGEEGAAGTSDAVIINGGWLEVHDLKYGYREVTAPNNRQLQIYALAALDEFAEAGPFVGVKLLIHQPRVSINPSIWEASIEQLEAFREQVKEAALYSRTVLLDVPPEQYDDHLTPGEDQCQWCRAKTSCRKLERFVSDTIGADFDDLEALRELVQAPRVFTPATLGQKMAAIPLIEMWAGAVRAQVEADLFAGKQVDGYKVVEGKRGNRKWIDEDLAAAELRRRRLKKSQIYKYSLISPTQAETLLKGNPRVWATVQDLIVQAPGKPSVAPESDPRPAISMTVEPSDFDVIDDASDLA